MRRLLWPFLALALAPACIQAQPTPAPDSGDAPCEEPPRAVVHPDQSHPDSEGFHTLFSGTDLKDWWLSCRSSHTSSGALSVGPIFRVDTARKALYSTHREYAGGVLLTRARFADYELVFDYWPDWGNDAALQHRTDSVGKAYSTPLGYMTATALGGVWGEAGLFTRDLRPFAFGEDETTIHMPGSSYSPTWTQITQKLKAAGEAFPCPETGCTQEDWRSLWDFDGWNQIRAVFHGGLNPGERIHARTWFRKVGAAVWVPIQVDTTLLLQIKPGFIGLMVHGSGRYTGPRGTWYRNIRWKPWTPSDPVAIRGMSTPASYRPAIRVDVARQQARITFAEGGPSGDIRVFSLDGRPMAQLRDIRGEGVLSMAGWKRGVYLLRMDAGGRRDWARLVLP